MNTPDPTLPPSSSPSEAIPGPAHKHSSRVRRWQKADVGVSDVVSDMARAVTKGVRTWRRESDKSQASRRNGALRDAVKNWGKATSKFLKVASSVPADLAEVVDPLTRRWLKK